MLANKICSASSTSAIATQFIHNLVHLYDQCNAPVPTHNGFVAEMDSLQTLKKRNRSRDCRKG
jgi:hypothetical protein